jgi:PAS domain S-box-containing protein
MERSLKEYDMRLNQSSRVGNHVRIEYQEQNEFIGIFKKNYKVTYVSPSLCNYFSRKQSNLIGKNFLNFIFKKDNRTIDHQLSMLAPDSPILTFEYRWENTEKKLIWHKWTFWAVFDNSKKFKEFRAIGRDITRRRKAEDDLQYAKSRYQSVVEDQMELVTRYLPNCTLTFANESYCNHFGEDRHHIIGNTFLHHMSTEDQKKLFQFIHTATLDNNVFTRVQHEKREDGKSIWIEWQRRALFDESGKIHEIQSIGRDITDLKKAEDALRSSEEALRKKNEELERKNTALIEVLEQIEHQKNQIKNDVVANIDGLLLPILKQMGMKGSKSNQINIDLLKRSLNNLTSSFGRKITRKSLKLSPREIQISNMVKQGLTSKEIANVLNISVHTVGRHRHNIRKKIHITNKERNLNTYLQSI